MFYLGLIFLGLVGYVLYSLFAVPRELRDIPAISLLETLISVLRGDGFDKRYELTMKPVLSKTGVARIWNQGRWELVLSDPRQMKEVLGSVDSFTKRREKDENLKGMLFRKTLGFSNILVSDGDEWRRHRRIVNPAFKVNWTPSMFAECTQKLIDEIISQDKPVDIHGLFARLTIDVLGHGLLGYDFGAVVNGRSEMLKIYTDVSKAMFHPFYLIFPFLENLLPERKANHGQSLQYRSFLRNIVRERKSNLDEAHNDLLTLMIKASIQDEGAQYSEEDVVNDLAVFFLAGHDTTANTLSTIFYYLSRHQDFQTKARDEVNKILNHEKRVPTANELKEMVYLDCIMKESMRIISTVAQLRRCCREEVELSGGLRVPADTFVSLQLWKLHHDDKLYPKPHLFDPDRFLSFNANHWMPFGGGSRMCIGMKFSLMEQRVVLATMLQKFTFHLGPDSKSLSEPKISPSGLLHPVDVDIVFNLI